MTRPELDLDVPTSRPSTYQGWSSWATWDAVLWARNDEDAYAWWTRMGRRYATVEDLAIALALDLPTVVPNADMDPDDWLDVDWAEVAEACWEDANA